MLSCTRLFAAGLALALLCPSSPAAAPAPPADFSAVPDDAHVYMQIPGMPGSSEVQGMQGWIELVDYSVDINALAPGLVHQDLNVSFTNDAALGPLLNRAFKNTTLGDVRLAWVTANGMQQQVMVALLNDLRVNYLSLQLTSQGMSVSLQAQFQSSSWQTFEPVSAAPAPAGSSWSGLGLELLVKLPNVDGEATLVNHEGWIPCREAGLFIDFTGPTPQLSPTTLALTLDKSWPGLVQLLTAGELLRDVRIALVSIGDGTITHAALTLEKLRLLGASAAGGQGDHSSFVTCDLPQKLKWEFNAVDDGQVILTSTGCYDPITHKTCH